MSSPHMSVHLGEESVPVCVTDRIQVGSLHNSMGLLATEVIFISFNSDHFSLCFPIVFPFHAAVRAVKKVSAH